MTSRLPQLASAALLAGLCSLVAVVSSGPATSQDPPPQPAPNDPNGNGVEVLARGPVHEAYASSAEQPIGEMEIVGKAPPEPIEELPPDQKPEGENVLWIPGYWDWDEERKDFLWVSGFWRNAPPNRVWVPGSWRQVQNGFQWVSGFWQTVMAVEQGQPQPIEDIQYLPEPPAPIEAGPTIPAPDETSVYVPGSWVWRNKYVWRPGVWIAYRPNWVWTPACYRWSPAGYVFVDGYWDYPLANRGVLFAPVYFSRPVYAAPTFVYSPTYVVSEPCLYGSLFVRRGYGSYYFGDYFDRRYVNRGYTAWNGISINVGGGGVNVNIGIGNRPRYFQDPLWSYYRASYRNNPGWVSGVNALYTGRYNGDIIRPPHTFAQQRTVVNNVRNNNVTIVNKNVTNNTIVNNNVINNINNVTMLTTMNDVRRTVVNNPGVGGPATGPNNVNNVIRTDTVKMQAVNRDVRNQEQAAAKQIRQVAVERSKIERDLVTKGPPPAKGTTDVPRTAKMNIPQPLIARTQIRDQAKAPPPNPIRTTQVNPKIDPKGPTPGIPPKVDPKTPGVPPKVDPKGNTPVMPKVDPKGNTPGVPPKIDPKGTNPGVPPKIDPKGTNPGIPPRIDPKGTNPGVPPKIDPKTPPVMPKGNTPGLPPGVDPKRPPANVEPKTPNVEPKRPPAMPKVEPKVPNPGVPPKVESPRPVPVPQPPKAETPRPMTPMPPPKVNVPAPQPKVNVPPPQPLQPKVNIPAPQPKVNVSPPQPQPKVNIPAPQPRVNVPPPQPPQPKVNIPAPPPKVSVPPPQPKVNVPPPQPKVNVPPPQPKANNPQPQANGGRPQGAPPGVPQKKDDRPGKGAGRR